MDYWTNIAVFAGFVAALSAWYVARSLLHKRFQKDPAIGRRLWFLEAQALLSTLSIFVFVWILSGELNWYLVGTFVIVAHLGWGVSYVTNELMSPSDTRSYDHGLAAGKEWDIKHPRSGCVLPALRVIALGIYVVACGVVFFTQQHSAARTVTFLQYALAMFFIAGIVFSSPAFISLTASKNLDPNIRTRIFSNQLGGLIISALYLGLLFLSLSAPAQAIAPDVQKSVSWQLAAQVTVVLVIFFILVILIPHIVGDRRGRKWRAELLKRKQQILVEISNILGPPVNAKYAERLTNLRDKIRMLIANFAATENDPMIEWMKGVKARSGSGGTLKPEEQVCLDCREFDPRFRYLDWLDELANGKDGGIEVIIADLQAKTTDKDRRDAAEDWNKRFKEVRTQLDEESKAEKENKPLLPTFALWIAAAVVPTFVGFIAVAIWKLLVVPDITGLPK